MLSSSSGPCFLSCIMSVASRCIVRIWKSRFTCCWSELFCNVQVGSAVRICGGSLSPSFWSGCLMQFWMGDIAGRHKNTSVACVCCMYNASEEYYHFSSKTAIIQPINSHHDCDNLILQPEWFWAAYCSAHAHVVFVGGSIVCLVCVQAFSEHKCNGCFMWYTSRCHI